MRPLLVLVTGPPGSGKTTLARDLAGAANFPLFSKDSVKVRLYDTLGWGGRERDRQLGRAAYAVLDLIADKELACGHAVVLESNFGKASEPWLREIVERHSAATIQIVCTAPREVLAERLAERAASGTRHPGHCDELWPDWLDTYMAEHCVLDLEGDVVEVDTTSGEVDVADLLRRIQAARQEPA